MRSLALASIHPPTAKLVFHNAIRRVSVPASSASTDFSLSICTDNDSRTTAFAIPGRNTTTALRRNRFPPMGRQFINCTSFILLSFPPSLSLSLPLSRFDRVLLRRPIRRKGVATRRPLEPLPVEWPSSRDFTSFRLRSRAENLLVVSQCTS